MANDMTSHLVVHHAKKLRSKIHRRRRGKISPVLIPSLSFSIVTDQTVDSSLSSDSYSSSRVSIAGKSRKREFEEVRSSGGDEVRRITRKLKKKDAEVEVEVSESSCVESCSGVFGDLKRSGENEKEIGEDEVSNVVTRSEISSVEQFLPGNAISCADSSISKKINQNLPEFESVELESKFVIPDLTCTEELSDEDFSDGSLSEETRSSELKYDEIFSESSELDVSSEYTPSSYFESGSQFSDRSVDDAYQSPTFSLFLEYRKQFYRSISPFDVKVSPGHEDVHIDELNVLRFDDIDDEESYQCFKTRERRQLYIHDYARDYGDLVLQQRLEMVHWMIEHSNIKELQKETLFLGVNLFDRLLSKGFFETKRHLQIVGVACLTLATRIEENQPYNSVRQKLFYVADSMYSRSEVVAMEWLVLEVLSFQCCLPTIYNFLWFYLKAARASEEMGKMVKHLAMLAILGHEQLSYWPSTVAASLVILVALASSQNETYLRVMQIHVRTEDDELDDCIKSLQGLIVFTG